MTRFRVRSEHLPARCEICHQADLFNAVSGSCGRCSSLDIPQLEPSLVPSSPRISLWRRFLRKEGIWGALFLCGFLAFLFVPRFFMEGPGRSAHSTTIAFPKTSRNVASHSDPNPGPNTDKVFEFPSLFSLPKPANGVDESEYDAKNIEFSLHETRKREHVHPAELSLKDAGRMKAQTRRGIQGLEFEAQADGKSIRCFIPGLSFLPGDAPKRIAELLSRKSRMTVSGHYDSETHVIFVERLVFKNAMTLKV